MAKEIRRIVDGLYLNGMGGSDLMGFCLSPGIMTFICRFQFVERVTTQKVLQCLL